MYMWICWVSAALGNIQQITVYTLYFIYTMSWRETDRAQLVVQS